MVFLSRAPYRHLNDYRIHRQLTLKRSAKPPLKLEPPERNPIRTPKFPLVQCKPAPPYKGTPAGALVAHWTIHLPYFKSQVWKASRLSNKQFWKEEGGE
jgi:hypothetical protein